MKQYTENQYDDDLTVGTEDYDDSYYAGSDDLLEFANDEESPISRLKSLILSIDWEITDDILMQFNEELVVLRDIWAGNKINLVYVQALEKISKYIYQKKADSHPSAIKLLITLYHNLEKIVSSFDLTEEQKKEILLEDVKRFESLKRHIRKQTDAGETPRVIQPQPPQPKKRSGTAKELLDLKAIVLGIDWEITDQDLNSLRQEVIRLEDKFAGSKPRLILLQGIGTLAAYIKLKKGNAHADAFKIVHLFYESLEKIVGTPMSLKEEKAILYPAVERFNAFKALLGPTINSEAISRDEKETDEEIGPTRSTVVAPAFADLREEEVKGFQAEEEARSLGFEGAVTVDDHVESFFMASNFQGTEVAASTAAPIAATFDGHGPAGDESHEVALQGVDVEVDDEEDVDVRVPASGAGLAPALSGIEEQEEPEWDASAQDEMPAVEQLIAEEDFALPIKEAAKTSPALGFTEWDEEPVEPGFGKLDRDMALQGVAVETEADDESDEAALPMQGGALAPALAENDELSMYRSEIFDNSSEIKGVDEEIAGTLGDFFDEEIKSHLAPTAGEASAFDAAVTAGAEPEMLFESKVDTAELEESPPAAFTMEKPLLSDEEFEALPAAALEEPMAGTQPLDEDDAIAFKSASESEMELEAGLDALFGDGDMERSLATRLEEELPADEARPAPAEDFGREDSAPEIAAQLDSFFDLEESGEEPEEERLEFALPEEPTEDLSVLDGVISPAAAPEIEEEEVVFTLAEEERPLVEAEPEMGQPVEAPSEELSTIEDDIFPLAPVTEEPGEGLKEYSETLATGPEADRTTDEFEALRTCVTSLGVALDDKVISGLSGEIDRLQQHLADKPLERTFLQLLSTIARHIDQNRYDASSDAYLLLQSVCVALCEVRQDTLMQNRYDASSDAYLLLQSVSAALCQVRQDTLMQNQELLFAETHKVLMWQEDLLAQQAAGNEAALTIGSSLFTVQESGEAAEHSDRGALGRAERATENLAGREDLNMLSADIKQEIAMLRQTLQREIEELRKELKGKHP